MIYNNVCLDYKVIYIDVIIKEIQYVMKSTETKYPQRKQQEKRPKKQMFSK